MCHQKNCADGDHNAPSMPWNGDRQKAKEEEKQKKEDQLRRKLTAKQHTNNYYAPSLQYRPSYDIQDRPLHHYRTEEERRERLELLNDKHNLDYYLESDLESEHGYEVFV